MTICMSLGINADHSHVLQISALLSWPHCCITLHCIPYAMTRLEEYIGNQRVTGSHRIFHYESSLKDLHNSKVIRRS